ncbi:hypothetical protein QFZ67_001343 [Streptomyces sp. V1I1]|nr:hypothetical protein [Streptomyces sp. V1I1]
MSSAPCTGIFASTWNDSLVTRAATGPTFISCSVCVTYAMNSSRLSPTMRRVIALCTSGTEATCRGLVSLSYDVRTSNDSRNVARKTEKVSLLIRLRMKIRTMRGLKFPAAIWTATSEMLKTTPMKVIIAALTVVTMVLASSATPMRDRTVLYSPAF